MCHLAHIRTFSFHAGRSVVRIPANCSFQFSPENAGGRVMEKVPLRTCSMTSSKSRMLSFTSFRGVGLGSRSRRCRLRKIFAKLFRRVEFVSRVRSRPKMTDHEIFLAAVRVRLLLAEREHGKVAWSARIGPQKLADVEGVGCARGKGRMLGCPGSRLLSLLLLSRSFSGFQGRFSSFYPSSLPRGCPGARRNVLGFGSIRLSPRFVLKCR